MVRMRSAVRIRPAAPKVLFSRENRTFSSLFGQFNLWVRVWVSFDPHPDPHAEMRGKGERGTDGKSVVPKGLFFVYCGAEFGLLPSRFIALGAVKISFPTPAWAIARLLWYNPFEFADIRRSIAILKQLRYFISAILIPQFFRH